MSARSSDRDMDLFFQQLSESHVFLCDRHSTQAERMAFIEIEAIWTSILSAKEKGYKQTSQYYVDLLNILSQRHNLLNSQSQQHEEDRIRLKGRLRIANVLINGQSKEPKNRDLFQPRQHSSINVGNTYNNSNDSDVLLSQNEWKFISSQGNDISKCSGLALCLDGEMSANELQKRSQLIQQNLGDILERHQNAPIQKFGGMKVSDIAKMVFSLSFKAYVTAVKQGRQLSDVELFLLSRNLKRPIFIYTLENNNFKKVQQFGEGKIPIRLLRQGSNPTNIVYFAILPKQNSKRITKTLHGKLAHLKVIEVFMDKQKKKDEDVNPFTRHQSSNHQSIKKFDESKPNGNQRKQPSSLIVREMRELKQDDTELSKKHWESLPQKGVNKYISLAVSIYGRSSSIEIEKQARALQKQTRDVLENTQNEEMERFGGLTVKQVVEQIYGRPFKEHCSNVQKGYYMGDLELCLLATNYSRPIHVYTEKANSFKRAQIFGEGTNPIRLLRVMSFNLVRYNAVVEKKKSDKNSKYEAGLNTRNNLNNSGPVSDTGNTYDPRSGTFDNTSIKNWKYTQDRYKVGPLYAIVYAQFGDLPPKNAKQHAKNLQTSVEQLLLNNRKRKLEYFGGLSTEQIVQQTFRKGFQGYIGEIKKGKFIGELELFLLSEHLNRTIIIYSNTKQSYKKMKNFGKGKNPIRLVTANYDQLMPKYHLLLPVESTKVPKSTTTYNAIRGVSAQQNPEEYLAQDKSRRPSRAHSTLVIKNWELHSMGMKQSSLYRSVAFLCDPETTELNEVANGYKQVVESQLKKPKEKFIAFKNMINRVAKSRETSVNFHAYNEEKANLLSKVVDHNIRIYSHRGKYYQKIFEFNIGRPSIHLLLCSERDAKEWCFMALTRKKLVPAVPVVNINPRVPTTHTEHEVKANTKPTARQFKHEVSRDNPQRSNIPRKGNNREKTTDASSREKSNEIVQEFHSSKEHSVNSAISTNVIFQNRYSTFHSDLKSWYEQNHRGTEENLVTLYLRMNSGWAKVSLGRYLTKYFKAMPPPENVNDRRVWIDILLDSGSENLLLEQLSSSKKFYDEVDRFARFEAEFQLLEPNFHWVVKNKIHNQALHFTFKEFEENDILPGYFRRISSCIKSHEALLRFVKPLYSKDPVKCDKLILALFHRIFEKIKNQKIYFRRHEKVCEVCGSEKGISFFTSNRSTNSCTSCIREAIGQGKTTYYNKLSRRDMELIGYDSRSAYGILEDRYRNHLRPRLKYNEENCADCSFGFGILENTCYLCDSNITNL